MQKELIEDTGGLGDALSHQGGSNVTQPHGEEADRMLGVLGKFCKIKATTQQMKHSGRIHDSNLSLTNSFIKHPHCLFTYLCDLKCCLKSLEVQRIGFTKQMNGIFELELVSEGGSKNTCVQVNVTCFTPRLGSRLYSFFQITKASKWENLFLIKYKVRVIT